MKAVGLVGLAGLALVLNGCFPPAPEGVCGDDDVNTVDGEECDDGPNGSDTCSIDCELLPFCGDGNVDDGEECDDGGDALGCDADCTPPECGDGYTNKAANEQCDDGYRDACGTCNAECSGAGTGPGSCGDGVACAEADEECDDGAANSEAPNAACRTNCLPQRCGDDVKDDGEECDDGYNDACGTCNAECSGAGTGPGSCGDGVSCEEAGATGANTELADGCAGPVCHALIRLDYLTLGLKGYVVIDGPDQPTDSTAAEIAATELFATKPYMAGNPPDLQSSAAGIHLFMESPLDFGGFAMVSALSGQIVAAGGIVWMGRGGWWEPTSFTPPAALACNSQAVTPATPPTELPGSCPQEDGAPAPESGDAANLALSLNLTKSFADAGSFETLVYLYTPSVGSCSPSAAEWLVVLSQKRN